MKLISYIINAATAFILLTSTAVLGAYGDEGKNTSLHCETAFAIHNKCVKYPDSGACMSVPLNEYFKSKRWGWATMIQKDSRKDLKLYAGAGKNDLSKGTRVGGAWYKYFMKNNGTCWLKVTVRTNDPYFMKESHLFVGNEHQFHKLKTPAPGKYPYSGDGREFESWKIKVKDCDEKLWVILHADVCEFDDGGDHDH